METLLFIKIAVAIGMVFILTLIAEKAGPKWAGVISGFPTGTAISLFFFGWEQGVEFASESALYNIAGLTGCLTFIFLYHLILKNTTKHSIFYSSVLGIVGYLLISIIIYYSSPSKLWAIIVPTITTLSLIIYFRKQENTTIKKRIPLTYLIIISRVLIASAIIISITYIPKIAGPAWSGLLSAFPSTLFPLLVIIHINYGKEHAQTIIKNMPRGIFSLIAYSFSISWAYPYFGIHIGTLISYAMALFVLLFYIKVEAFFQATKASREME